MPRLQKFSKKSFRAFSSWNRTEEGVGSEEEDALERRGFWDGVDLRLGAMKQLTQEREIKGNRETIRKAPTRQYIKI